MLFGRKTSEENKICENLTYKENELCFQQIGVKCKSLSTSIVQVFQTSPPKHDKWRKVESGVLCFVKDNQKKSYFFKLIKLDNSAVVVWEEEIYIGLIMERIKPFLISFEGQNGIVAFSFAFDTEAEHFFSVACSTIEKRDKNMRNKIKPAKVSKKSKEKKSKNEKQKEEQKNDSQIKKQKYSKDLISAPSNFTHIAHWDQPINEGMTVTMQNTLPRKSSPNLPPRDMTDATATLKIQRAPFPPPKNRPLPELPELPAKKHQHQDRCLPSIPAELPQKISVKPKLPNLLQKPSKVSEGQNINAPPPPPMNLVSNINPSPLSLSSTKPTSGKPNPIAKIDKRNALLDSIRSFKDNKALNKVDLPEATPFKKPISASPFRLALEKIQDSTRYSSSSEEYEEVDDADSDEWSE